MYKRVTAVFCVLIFLLAGLVYRIYYITASDNITSAASVQGKYRMTVATTRGMIYDRHFLPLVNIQHKYVASVLPTLQAANTLLSQSSGQEREGLLDHLSGGRPFALRLEDNNVYAEGVDVFRVPERYGEIQYAPHLIGYLGDGGVGVAGIERAYDEVLAEKGGTVGVVYQMDAAGRMMEDGAVAVERSGEQPIGGVVLTLDRDIQQAVQQALAAGCDRGAAVVLDVQSGDVLAMASQPVFDQNDIAASLQRTDAPFINRAVSGYNIGSVFKLLIAAAALENNISQYQEFVCTGYTDVEGQVFRCNNNAVHGVCDMERALEVSCNSYFIQLAQLLPPETVLGVVRNMGLGSSVELIPGTLTASGNLPSPQELSIPAVYANFSFGQGSSLASPLQIAQAIAAIANGGNFVTPRLVRGVTEDSASLTDETPVYASNRVVSARTAEVMRELMVAVVEEGSGRTAQPLSGGAGGKTSSAQTGQYDGEDGDANAKEIVHAWFAGFYPAEEPRYSIVVFVEGGESGERVAGPIFKQIADTIARVKK